MAHRVIVLFYVAAIKNEFVLVDANAGHIVLDHFLSAEGKEP